MINAHKHDPAIALSLHVALALAITFALAPGIDQLLPLPLLLLLLFPQPPFLFLRLLPLVPHFPDPVPLPNLKYEPIATVELAVAISSNKIIDLRSLASL